VFLRVALGCLDAGARVYEEDRGHAEGGEGGDDGLVCWGEGLVVGGCAKVYGYGSGVEGEDMRL
jgi:hypothetical protein